MQAAATTPPASPQPSPLLAAELLQMEKGPSTMEASPILERHAVSGGLMTPKPALVTRAKTNKTIVGETNGSDVYEYDDDEDDNKVADFESFEEFLCVAAPMLWLLFLIFVGHIIIEWILGVDMPRCVDYLLHPISTVGTFRTGRANGL